jgi:hypothetical protein
MTNAAAKKAPLESVITGHPGTIYSPNQAGVVEGLAALKRAATVTKIRARNAELNCPHCGAEQDGWMVDPRGREQTCDACNQPYQVAPDALVQIS